MNKEPFSGNLDNTEIPDAPSNAPVSKNLITEQRYHLYDDFYKMSEAETTESSQEEFDGDSVDFTLTAGPLLLSGRALQNTYVVEVSFPDSQYKAHLAAAGGVDFAMSLQGQYCKKMAKLVANFCDQQGFNVKTHVNSFPVFQVVAERTPAS